MNTLIFTDSGSQFPISFDDVECLIHNYAISSKRTNGAFVQYTIKGEYPASIVVPVHSEVYVTVDAQWKRDRKASRA